MFRCQFLCHVLKALFFIKIALKFSIFAKKCKIFERWGLRSQTPLPPAAGSFAPRPPASGSWGPRPQTPKHSPPLQISGYAPAHAALLHTILCELYYPGDLKRGPWHHDSPLTTPLSTSLLPDTPVNRRATKVFLETKVKFFSFEKCLN